MIGRFFIVLILLFTSVQGISEERVKYGKLSKEEKQLEQCEFEPEADAVLLKHIGNIEVNSAGVVIEKHIRIKILNEKGLDHANVSLPFYSKDGFEKITKIKAQTLNPDEKGRIESFEVDKKEFYEIDLSEEWKEIRFTFPNVKVGSIVEYKYTVVSENYLYLDKWDFQHELPTIHSALKVLTPEYLQYRVLIQGYRLMKKYRGNIGNSWELENLPSIKEEPYLYNINDYTEKVKFQLAVYQERQYYGGAIEEKSLLKTWEGLAEEVLTSWPYTSYMNKKGFARDVLEQLETSDMSDTEKTKAIYNYVKNNYQWNGGYRRSTYNKFNDFTDKKSGYSSEINLLLTLLLTEAEIDAYPMLVSTRSNGLTSSDYSFLSQFNHLIVYVNHEGEKIYLDATDPFRPWFLLSEESNVSQGFILNKKEPKWEGIKSNPKSSRQYSFVFRIEDESFKVQSGFSTEGYPAVNLRKEIYEKGKKKWFERKIKPSIKVLEDSIKLENLDEVDKALKAKSDFSFPLKSMGEMVYLNPFILNELNENPFNNNSRYYPVQYPYEEAFSYRANFLIPENFEIVEIPESQRIKLPNGYGDFTYAINQFGNSISMQVIYNINQTEIPATQYQNLREYYSIIISKLNQQIVMKRKM